MDEQTFSKRTLKLLNPDNYIKTGSLLIFTFKRKINEALIVITIKIREDQEEESLHGNIYCKKEAVVFRYTEYFKTFDSFLYYLDYGNKN